MSFGNEYRIIAKSSIPSRMRCNGSADNALKSMRMVIEADQGDYRSELRVPVRCVLKIFQEQLYIVGAVALRPGITGRVHAGCAIENIHFESGIIGKAGNAKMIVYVAGLLQGITRDRRLRLG